MENFTDTGSLSDNFNISCDEITNHWLYFIFTGYLAPLISPRLRRYFKETLNGCKNNEVTGKIVTLTEFGFEKIQDIQNNDEMKNFIRRMCIDKKIEYNEETIEHVSWLFSGDNDDKHQSIKQTWKRLEETLENFQDIKSSLRP